MKHTHTSGPWRVAYHNSGLIKVETKDRVICDGFAGEQANAHLIAAAPELLEMLESLLATAEAVDASNKAQHGTDCAGFAQNLFVDVRSIIAKAKGGEE